MDIEYFLKLMAEKNASDLFLTTGAPVNMKVEGKLYALGNTGLPPGLVKKIAYSLMDEAQVVIFERDLEMNMAISVTEAGRFRVNVFKQRGEIGMVIRAIKSDIPSIEDLKLPTILKDIVLEPRGLVLLVCSTGSGKSTTLASMIDHRNNNVTGHILTIEDPIEFLHQHKRCIVNQREIGSDAKGFSEALRAALRQDPDVILLGEMRDLETIATALTAAETGHLVFGTLHTQSAPSTIDRIIDVFPAEQQEQIRIQIASSLQGVITQALLPTADGMGRVPALEVLLPDDAVRNLVRQGKVEQIYSVMQTNTSRGMQTMEQSLADLIQRGVVTFEVGLTRSSRPQQLIGVLERAGFPVELPPDLNEQTSDQQPLAAGLRVAGS